jgi:hypothetical protein
MWYRRLDFQARLSCERARMSWKKKRRLCHRMAGEMSSGCSQPTRIRNLRCPIVRRLLGRRA